MAGNPFKKTTKQMPISKKGSGSLVAGSKSMSKGRC